VLGLSGTPSTARRLCSEPSARHSFGDWVYLRNVNILPIIGMLDWFNGVFLGKKGESKTTENKG
jgi:hypothetical protein